MGLLSRLRESVSGTDLPQLQRGTDVREKGYSTKKRVKMAKRGAAIPVRNDKGDIVGGRYPIDTRPDVENAVDDVNRSGGGAEEKAHVIKNAQRIGATDAVPDDWKTREDAAAGDVDDDGDAPDEKDPLAAGTEGDATGLTEAGALRIFTRIREAQVAKSGNAYEATILREGPGNPEDRNYYTKEALQKAVASRLFEGLQAYANHPTPSEERERPERDVRQLVGHFREARYVEEGGAGKVKAKFVPIQGQGYEWVTSLIESALAAVPGKPLIGISIDGYGHAPDEQEIGGRTYNMVREVTDLGSADLVTRAGAGGEFHRRLQESWRKIDPAHRRPGRTDTRGGAMKPAKLQEKIKAAAAKLEEAAGLKDDDERGESLVNEAVTELRECATAELEVEIREVEKPVAASDDEPDQIATRLREVEIDRDKHKAEAKDERRRRKDAESRLEEVDKAKLAAKILREAEVSEKAARSWFDEIVEQDDEETMRRFVERKKAERDEMLAELRESFGVEGAGARLPSAPARAGKSLADAVGIDRDELETAAA